MRASQPLRPWWIRSLAAVAVLAASSPSPALPASAQATGGWSQAGADGAHTRAIAGPRPAYRRAWHLEVEPGGATGRQGLSQPIVSGDTVIATAPDEVIAVDSATGATAWTVDRDGGPPAPPAVVPEGQAGVLVFTEGWAGHPPSTGPTGATGAGPSPSSSPASTPAPGEEVDSRLVGIDLATMDPAWPPIALDGVSRSGVSVEGSTVFVGDQAGGLVAVDAGTGRVVWRSEVGGAIDLAPAVGEGSVLVALRATRDARAAVVAFDAQTGERRWRAEPSVQAPTGISIADGVAFVSGLDLPLEALDLGSGVPTWRVHSPLGGPVEGGVALTRGTAVSVDRRGLLTASTFAGERRWDFAINRAVARGAPAIVGEEVLVASEDGALQAFDLATGDRRWRGVAGSGPARGIAVGGDVVVVLRAGVSAGLDGWVADPAAPLERLGSPTRFDPARGLLAFAGAAVPLALASLVLSRATRDRFGPTLPEGEGPEDPLEPSQEDPR